MVLIPRWMSNSHICPFCPFVLLKGPENIGRFEKNISMIEIKHWEVSIQISQCFFYLSMRLYTSLCVMPIPRCITFVM